jgi:uncharacterized membrane protein YcaP (DUF421 family)
MMESLIGWLFGEGPNLTFWQMAARAASVFLIALVLVRISGRRSFGQHSPFDACTTVLVGAILSRAVVGANPFWPTICGAATIVVMHRLIGQASVRWPKFEALISGHELHLVRNGKPDADQMRRALITDNDLKEAIRKKLGDSEVWEIESAVLERNGDITVIEGKATAG